MNATRPKSLKEGPRLSEFSLYAWIKKIPHPALKSNRVAFAGQGGGIVAVSVHQSASLVTNGTIFSENTAESDGGAISVLLGIFGSASVVATNTKFLRNTAGGFGGAIATDFDGTADLSSCVLSKDLCIQCPEPTKHTNGHPEHVNTRLGVLSYLSNSSQLGLSDIIIVVGLTIHRDNFCLLREISFFSAKLILGPTPLIISRSA